MARRQVKADGRGQEGPEMRGFWRVMVALLLVGAPAFWMPTYDVDASSGLPSVGTTVHSPAEVDKDEAKELCKNPNPRKQKKCKYNGWDNGNWRHLNDNDADNESSAVPSPTPSSVASLPGGLTVELLRSSDAPAPNTPLTLTVGGSGGSIAALSWRSTGPTASDLIGGDMAHLGELIFECASVTSCSNSWTVTPKYNGYYSVYAKVRDVAGQEVETVWRFTAGEPPR